jgi:hypothetical protein
MVYGISVYIVQMPVTVVFTLGHNRNKRSQAAIYNMLLMSPRGSLYQLVYITYRKYVD